MNESKYTFLSHLGAALVAGLVFSLAVGLIFSLKMIGINEATHQFLFAYPFALNFIPMYVLLGLIFGVAMGIVGGLLLIQAPNPRGLGF